MEKRTQCDECGSMFIEPIHRDCFDICDTCYNKMQERLTWLSDRDNRMYLAKAASFWANNEGTKAAQLAGFFACVMPEYPALKVRAFIKAATS